MSRLKDDGVERWEGVYHLISWGIPAAFTLSLSVGATFSDGGVWYAAPSSSTDRLAIAHAL